MIVKYTQIWHLSTPPNLSLCLSSNKRSRLKSNKHGQNIFQDSNWIEWPKIETWCPQRMQIATIAYPTWKSKGISNQYRSGNHFITKISHLDHTRLVFHSNITESQKSKLLPVSSIIKVTLPIKDH